MTYGSRTDHYPASSKWLHWLVAICVLVTAAAAVTMDWIVGEGPTQDTLYIFHESLGPLILLLMILRLINRLIVGAPMAEPGIAPWQKTVSSIVHGLLYALLLVMPVLGYIANSAYGEPTPFFRLFKVPPAIAKDEALATTLFTLHRWIGWVVIALVLMHVGAAIYHHLAGDNVLRRMLPQALGGAEVAARAPVRSR